MGPFTFGRPNVNGVFPQRPRKDPESSIEIGGERLILRLPEGFPGGGQEGSRDPRSGAEGVGGLARWSVNLIQG